MPTAMDGNGTTYVFCLFFHVYTSSYLHYSPGFRDPSKSAGPPGITEWIKIPRSSFPVFSPPTIWKPIKKGPKQAKMSF